MPDGRFRMTNSPFSLVVATKLVPVSSTLVSAFVRLSSSNTVPESVAFPLFVPAAAGDSNTVRASSSNGLSPSEIGISPVMADPRRACSVASSELGSPLAGPKPDLSVRPSRMPKVVNDPLRVAEIFGELHVLPAQIFEYVAESSCVATWA